MGAATPLRILVTNDDGAASPGLWHLAHRLAGPGREVVVAAPRRDSSGFAAAVGDVVPGAVVEVEQIESPSPWRCDGMDAWVVEGPPGRCVLAGVLGIFGPRPDLVVSGINAGANVGRFLQLHSGTLGAALTAGNSGLRAMAVSLDTPVPAVAGDELHWEAAARVAEALVGQLSARPRATVWNVNVPNAPLHEIIGIAEAQLGRSRHAFEAREIGGGRHELHLTPVAPRGDVASGASDRELLDARWVAITSVTLPGLATVGEVALDLV